MGKIIALANQKGGVGKTSTTLNFGLQLSEKGKKVLLIDFDHQANLTLACGIENFDDLEETIATTIANIINGKEAKLPIKKYNKNIDFVPSNVLLSNVNLLMIQAFAREYLLKKILYTVKEEYDYILIDCAPSLSVDLINALTTSDEVLIISTPAKFSASGTNELLKTIEKIKENFNKDLKIAGVLLNKVDRRTNFNKDMISIMRDLWQGKVKVFNTEIPSSIRLEESIACGSGISEYEPKSKVAKSFKMFLDEYLEKGVDENEIQHG